MVKFGKDYFIGGNESNYTDYRKKKFDKQADDLIFAFKLEEDDFIVDYGCATGGLVAALKERGINHVIGTDISDWAINIGKKTHPNIRLEHYNRNLLVETYYKKDLIIMLDVLEHMDDDELRRVIALLKQYPPKKGIVIRMPVSKKNGGKYVLDVSENDKTHVQRLTKFTWKNMFSKAGYHFEPLNLRTIYDTEGVLAGVLRHVN